jgi:hypothetical protein
MICVSRTPATITGAAVSPIGLTPPSHQMHAATAIVTSKLNRAQVPDAPSQSGDQTAAAASNPTATVSVVVGRGGAWRATRAEPSASSIIGKERNEGGRSIQRGYAW